MIGRTLVAGVACAAFAGPLFAQAVDSHQPFNDGSAAASMSVPPGAVAPGYDPGTRAANLSIGHSAVTDNAEAEDAWRADLGRYRAELRSRRQEIAMTRETQMRRDAAYDRAMNAWHAQVAACHDGDRRACLAPTPNPAAFE
jgi:hypothetical protein